MKFTRSGGQPAFQIPHLKGMRASYDPSQLVAKLQSGNTYSTSWGGSPVTSHNCYLVNSGFVDYFCLQSSGIIY